jgi:thioredoxin reductase (NADPH)
VYGASEGLSTILIDRVAAGGQVASSSLIENYLGFPAGLSGIELTSRALAQAGKFGARVSTPVEAVALDFQNGQLQVLLSDGSALHAGSVILATGAHYRTLPLDGWSEYEGAGIYYGATEIEARACSGRPVAVIGGANSAGQAALFLADRGSEVHVIVRNCDLAADMSRYLVARVCSHPLIQVHTDTECTVLHGGNALSGITITASSGESITMECHGLFCFIGAVPATAWLSGVALDPDGYVRTDRDLRNNDLGVTWALLGREPLPFETSIPGVFAAGDVRSGAMKRVISAVAEGASAVKSIDRMVLAR